MDEEKNIVRERLPETGKEEKILKAEDLYFTPEEIEKASTERVPAEYIPVKLSSVGKLGVPSIIHVKDYSFDEIISFAEMEDENETEVIIQILNGIIYEDFDAGELHRNDVTEILMTIQGTWYSPRLEDMAYYLKEDLPSAKRETLENLGRATLYFHQISTKPLSEEIKMPITIKYRNEEVQFILPKIGNELIASKLVNTKYSQRQNELAEIKSKVEKKTQTIEEMGIYEQFLKEKTRDFIKISQALLLVGYNGKKLESLEEKLEILPKLSIPLLRKYTELIETDFNFGIQPEVTFESEELKETITRRFDFRPYHFLSTVEQKDDTGFDISYG